MVSIRHKRGKKEPEMFCHDTCPDYPRCGGCEFFERCEDCEVLFCMQIGGTWGDEEIDGTYCGECFERLEAILEFQFKPMGLKLEDKSLR